MPPPFDLMPRLLLGLAYTLIITIGGGVLGFAIALLAGFGRLSSRRWIRAAAVTYVEVFRGSSALVQIFVWFYVMPLFGLRLGPIETGIVALGVNVGAYGAEVVRAAIQGVERGQREAAIAINMPHWMAMRRIILPQAFVAMLPPLGNLAIELLKTTSLVSLIGLTELTFAGRQILQTEGLGRREETYVLTLLLYLAVAYPMTLAFRRLERRLSRGMHLGRAR